MSSNPPLPTSSGGHPHAHTSSSTAVQQPRHAGGGASAAAAAAQPRQLGPYVLNLVSTEDNYLVYDAFEPSKPQRRLRSKAYIKVRVDPQRISNTIKIQEALKRTCERLRVLTGREPAAAAAAGDNNNNNNTSSTLTDDQLLFLSYCGDHLLLLENKMQSSSKFFLVREYMPDTIYNVLQHGRLQEEGAFYYFFQVLQAVQFLHENDIRHRNICSEHLYLSASGTILKLGGMSSCVRDTSNGNHYSLLTPTNHNTSVNHGLLDSLGGAGNNLNASGSTAAATRALAASPQPGSYGICSHCHRDIPIVAEMNTSPTSTSPTNAANASASASPSSGGSPPLNALYTTCRYCGVAQNRLQVLLSAVGTPSYLAPEVLTYHRPPSLMNTASSLANQNNNQNQNYNSWTAEYPITEGQAIDVWACGVVLFHMLTASLPFDPIRKTNTNTSNNNNNSSNDPQTSKQQQQQRTATPEEKNEMCSRIVAIDYKVPAYVSPTAKQILETIFVRNPMSRPRAIDLMALSCFDRVRASLVPARK